ncbi:MAG: HlyD family efflux transporter periplasmic adaptor subunit [Mycobacteriales bacterium]|nr:HlyD family efflux transporter periplasmic adaptor subunit [Mycobacteriales bacterium]
MIRPLTLAALLLVPLAGCTSDDRAVTTGAVTRETITEVVEAPATVTARAVASVTSPADAVVAQVLVEDGADVRRGAVLLRLTSESATGALRTALAAQAVGGDAVSRALAASTLQSARATVDALTVRAPIDGVVTFGGSVASDSPTLDALPGALQGLAGSLLGGASSGSDVTTNELSVGAPVGAGAGLLTVTDVSALGLAAEVDETDVLLVKAGTTAQVQLDAVPTADYTATVTGVDLAPLSSAGGGVGYRVRLALTGTPAPRPGMSAVVRLKVREASSALSVPSAAVVRDGADDVVYAVVDGVVRRRVVAVGAQGVDRVEVTSGLAEGDVVVVRDADGLRDGQRVDT